MVYTWKCIFFNWTKVYWPVYCKNEDCKLILTRGHKIREWTNYYIGSSFCLPVWVKINFILQGWSFVYWKQRCLCFVHSWRMNIVFIILNEEHVMNFRIYLCFMCCRYICMSHVVTSCHCLPWDENWGKTLKKNGIVKHCCFRKFYKIWFRTSIF